MPLFNGESDDATRFDEQNPGPQRVGVFVCPEWMQSAASPDNDRLLKFRRRHRPGPLPCRVSASGDVPRKAPHHGWRQNDFLEMGWVLPGWRGQKLFAVKCGRLPAQAGRDRAVVSASLRPSPFGSRPFGLPSTDVKAKTSPRETAGAGVGQPPMFDHTLHHLSPVSLRCAPVSKVNELRRASSR